MKLRKFTGTTGTYPGSDFVGVGTTCTVTVSNSYSANDMITVSGVTNLTAANGTFKITSATGSQFVYTMLSSQSLTGTGTATYHREPSASTEGYANMQRIIINGNTVTTN